MGQTLLSVRSQVSTSFVSFEITVDRSTQDSEKKLDLLSQQVSALAALTLVGISVGGDGLLSKGGILSGLFTEDLEEEIESNLTTNPSPTKSGPRNPIYRDSKEPENNLTPFMDFCSETIDSQRHK